MDLCIYFYLCRTRHTGTDIHEGVPADHCDRLQLHLKAPVISLIRRIGAWNWGTISTIILMLSTKPSRAQGASTSCMSIRPQSNTYIAPKFLLTWHKFGSSQLIMGAAQAEQDSSSLGLCLLWVWMDEVDAVKPTAIHEFPDELQKLAKVSCVCVEHYLSL